MNLAMFMWQCEIQPIMQYDLDHSPRCGQLLLPFQTFGSIMYTIILNDVSFVESVCKIWHTMQPHPLLLHNKPRQQLQIPPIANCLILSSKSLLSLLLLPLLLSSCSSANTSRKRSNTFSVRKNP